MLKALHTQTKGSSLIEAAAVVLIISIVMIQVLPKTLHPQFFIENNFYRKIFNTLIYAQTLAIYSGCDIGIQSQPNSLSLLLREQCGSGNFNIQLKHPSNHHDYILNTPKGINLQPATIAIYFDKNGQTRSIATQNIIDLIITINGIQTQQNIHIVGYNGTIKFI